MSKFSNRKKFEHKVYKSKIIFLILTGSIHLRELASSLKVLRFIPQKISLVNQNWQN